MQPWMTALIIIAAVIAFAALAMLIAALVCAQITVGRRKKPWAGEYPEKYGVDTTWLDSLAKNTEMLELVSFDGLKLKALLIKHAEGAHSVAICQHGYASTPSSVQVQARIFYERGCDVLLPAARGHSFSEGNTAGMAWLDRFDILRWTDRIISLYGEDVKIALWGVSMGGATVVAAAGMEPPEQVKFVVDDCGFCSQRDEYAACAKNMHLPVAPSLFFINIGVKLRCGYSIKDADLIPLAQNVRMPALFIHGDNDVFVPTEQGVRMYEACGSADKRLLVIEGAAHATAYVEGKEQYTAALSDMIDKYLA